MSTTNNQVAGVDEADFVKNDDKYIYQVDAGGFRILEAWPAARTHQIALAQVPGRPVKLFVHDDRAVIYTEIVDDSQSNQGGCYDCGAAYGSNTAVLVYDVKDRHAGEQDKASA